MLISPMVAGKALLIPRVESPAERRRLAGSQW